jgi:20S proteasome alpha/beta subunit
MTVCIAAICENDVIIGASDRMLTAGSTEFEPAPSSKGQSFLTKILPVNESIALMTAGSASLQTEIAVRMAHEFELVRGNQPPHELTVPDVVEHYIRHYNAIRANVASHAILAPLGLDQNSFIGRQKEMNEVFIREISSQLLNFSMPDIQTLVVGRDSTGAHLYKIDQAYSQCYDAIGFAAIGSGASHAESQFMLNGYNRLFPQEEAMWLTFLAKRKAEVAPGVGQVTDMFAIVPKRNSTPGFSYLMEAMNWVQLNAICDRYEAAQQEAFRNAGTQLTEQLKKYRDVKKAEAERKKD